MLQQIFLMRHAQSVHNLQKKKWKKGKSNDSQRQEYNRFRFSAHLRDPQSIGVYKVRLACQYLNEIDLIITSPLRRCLDTARECAKSTGGRVLVEPLLNSRMSAAWSVGTETSILKQLYPEFDFSFLENLGEYWMKYFITNKNQELHFKNRNLGQDPIQTIFKTIQEGKVEPYDSFQRRVTAFRRVFLKQLTRNHQYGYCPKILIISHNCVLNVLCGRSYQNGKLKNKFNFNHCSPVRLSFVLELNREQAKI